MKPTDPIDLFNHLEPPTPADADERNATILAAVHQHARTTKTKRARNPWVVGGGAVVVVLATAAFALVWTARVSDPAAVSCYETVDLGGDLVGLAASDDPVAACRQLWLDGTLGTGDVPPLTACVNEAGAAAVIPAEAAACNRLGLAELEAGLTDDQQAIIEINETLIDLFGGECLEQDAAIEAAQQQLDKAGLDDWIVDAPEPFDPATPCAIPGIDNVNRRIIVIGARER